MAILQRFRLLGLCVCMLLAYQTQAAPADTIFVSLPELEKRFLVKNLALLAEKYNIEIGKAFQIQAKLWENPNLYFEQNIYNPESKVFMPLGAGGEKVVQFNQLFYLAGKRNKRLKVEQLKTEMAEYAFFDMIRTLKMELRASFYAAYYNEQALEVYGEEILALRRLVELYRAQHQKGNVSLNEVVRLSAFLFELENEQNRLKTQSIENQSVLKLLIADGGNAYLRPQVLVEPFGQNNFKQTTLAALSDSALALRKDLKWREKDIRLQEANLALQKAMAVPDMTWGLAYDQAGNYVNHYAAFTFAIDIPLWNRNQGQIQAAKVQIQQSEALLNNQRLTVLNEVQTAYLKALEIDAHWQKIDAKFFEEYEKLMAGVRENYEKKNISLVEFLDFYEAYKSSLLQMNQLRLNRALAFEELNFAAGGEVVK